MHWRLCFSNCIYGALCLRSLYALSTETLLQRIGKELIYKSFTFWATSDDRKWPEIDHNVKFRINSSQKQSRPKIEIRIRNKELSKYSLNVNELVLKIIKTERLNKYYNAICILYPTAILRNYSDIQKAYRRFLITKADSIIAATNFDFPAHQALIPTKKNFFFQSLSKKHNSPKYNNLYKNTFVDNGSLYLSKIKTFINLKTFYSKKLCI